MGVIVVDIFDQICVYVVVHAVLETVQMPEVWIDAYISVYSKRYWNVFETPGTCLVFGLLPVAMVPKCEES